LFLRGKYQFVRSAWLDVAAGLVLRMPTGSQDAFQGTGDWRRPPPLSVSPRRVPVAGPVAIQGFFNGGFDLNIDDVDRSQGRFGAGVDLALASPAAFSVAFL